MDTPFRKALLRVVRAADSVRLQQEANALSRLQHPNIQGVLGLETSGEDLFLVTEAVQGTLLSAFIQSPPLPLKAALEIAVQLADALATAHAREIVHADVRPENVLLTADGRALLSGFNLRSSLDGSAGDSPYRAPEARPAADPAPAHDAYALGVVLVELVTGSRVEGVPPEARTALSLDIEVPDALRDLVVRLTHPDPEARATVTDAREALVLALRQSLGDRGPSVEETFVDYDGGRRVATEVPAPGQVGRYTVVREIGRGGVGVVYEAEDPGLRRRVALKVLLAGNFARARDIERFLREARAVAKLDHPGIVKILELGREGGGAWFAMEYVDGPTLLDRIRKEGGLQWEEAVRIAAELARALQHAHGHGLVHRDVKPNNVLLEEGTRPRLTDFGLALEQGNESTRLTRTGQVLGTPMYMSPEQATGDLENLGPRTDVYALGVLLYEALTGKVPYDGATPLQVIGKLLAGDPVPPRTLNPAVPRPVELACLKAMRRDIPDRYASAAELAEDLERCLRGEPILAAAPSLRDHARWFVRRNRTLLGVAGAAILATVLVTGGSLLALRAGAAREEAAREASARQGLENVLARIEQLEERGQPDEAEAAWQSFAARPDHRGTSALVDGWLARAAHQAEQDDSAGRLAALGRAYASAQRAADQQRALLALARGLRAEQQLDRLGQVVETLRRRAPEIASDPEVLRLHRDALVAQRDLPGAAELGVSDAASAAVRALSRATRTEHRADQAVAWPGSDAALLLRLGDADRMQLVDASMAEVRRLRVPVPVASRQVYPLPGGLLLVGVNRGGTALLREEEGRLKLAGDWPEGGLTAAISADLDSDGVVEHFYGADRDLFRLTPGPDGTWARDVPHPGTRAAASSVNDLAVGDLDGDGRAELIAAVAEWGAYDVRVLRPDAGGALRLAARRKLGVVTDLVTLRGPTGVDEVLATKHDRYPNRRVFPEDSLTGAPRGLWRLRERGGLDAERLLPVTCGALSTGDIDGDGRADVAGDCGGDLLLLIQREDGSLQDLWLRRLRLLTLADLDDDPAAEVVVSDPDDDDVVWVLGAGTEAPPALLPTLHAADSPPEGTEPVFAASWRRAEDLVYIGQLGQAAAALEELAQLQWGREAGWQALLRAADLHDAAGTSHEAARLYEQVATDAPEHRAEALAAAARAWREHRATDEERAALERLRALGPLDTEAAQRLTALSGATDLPTAELAFDEELDPRWQIEDPLAISRTDRGLEVDAYGSETLARLPVAWSGGPLRLEVEVDVERTEWDGGIEIGLAPRAWGAPLFGIRIDGRGGGDIVWRRLQCLAGDAALDRRVDDLETPLVARLHVFAAGDGLACELEQAGEQRFRVTRERELVSPGADEAWELVIRATGLPETLATATLKRIRIEGATIAPDEPPDHPLVRARHALADGSASRAAKLLDDAALDDPLLRIALALHRDDPDALRHAVRKLLDAGAGEQAVRHLLHARLDEVRPALAPLLADAWPFWFQEAWGVTLLTHPADPVVVQALLEHLPGLEQVEPDSTEALVALLQLNALRGAAEVRGGRYDLGRSCLRRALSLHDRLATSPDPEEQALAESLRRTIAAVHVDLAVLALQASDGPEAALAALRRALAIDPAPEVRADAIAVRTELQPLAGEPGFRDLLDSTSSGR